MLATPMRSGDAPRQVLVGIPTLDGMVTADLAAFVCALPIQGQSIGCQFSLQFVPGVRPVHYARNLFVKSFLESDAELLWFIDHDMLPDASALALLDVDADIVVGRALAFQTQRDGSKRLVITAYPQRTEGGVGFRAVSSSVDAPVPIVGGGAGNLLIHRRVLEDPRMRLDPGHRDWEGHARSLDDEPDAAPAIFRTPEAPNGRTLMGEDIDFVHRAASLGYRCLYQPNARMGHRKSLNLDDVERCVEDAVATAASREVGSASATAAQPTPTNGRSATRASHETAMKP